MNRWLDNLGLIIAVVALGISLGFGFYVVRHVSEHQAKSGPQYPGLYPFGPPSFEREAERRLEYLESEARERRQQEMWDQWRRGPN